jgi:hypothetical protein
MAHGKPEAERWRSHDALIGECIGLGTRRNKWFVGLRMEGSKDFAASLRDLYNFRLEADYEVGLLDRRRARRGLNFIRDFLEEVNKRIP